MFSDIYNSSLIIIGTSTQKADQYAPFESGVTRYQNQAARNATEVSPSEGRVVYLLDTDELQIYNGTEWITVIDTGNSENITASTLTVGTLTATGLSSLSASTAIGDVSATEINYLNGVTGNIQTQLDAKAPSASPTFTGVPLAPTATAGTNTTQLATTAFVGAAVSVGMPTGAVIPYAGSSAPTGWLICDGGSSGILRTTYAALFAVIGTTYGSGDGSTTFNVPDLRGRVPAGKDNMGGIAANRLSASVSGVTGTTLGASGGSQSLTSHNHTQNSHNHTQDSHNHTQNSHNHTQDAHAHSNSLSSNTVAASGHVHSGGGLLAAVGATNGDIHRVGYVAGGVLSGNMTYSIRGVPSETLGTVAPNHNTPVYGNTGAPNADSVVAISNANATATNQAQTASNIATTATNQATTATNNATGVGASENIQPTIILNYIIKA
jgi:microcystin-dependent protein